MNIVEKLALNLFVKFNISTTSSSISEPLFLAVIGYMWSPAQLRETTKNFLTVKTFQTTAKKNKKTMNTSLVIRELFLRNDDGYLRPDANVASLFADEILERLEERSASAKKVWTSLLAF